MPLEAGIFHWDSLKHFKFKNILKGIFLISAIYFIKDYFSNIPMDGVSITLLEEFKVNVPAPILQHILALLASLGLLDFKEVLIESFSSPKLALIGENPLDGINVSHNFATPGDNPSGGTNAPSDNPSGGTNAPSDHPTNGQGPVTNGQGPVTNGQGPVTNEDSACICIGYKRSCGVLVYKVPLGEYCPVHGATRNP